MWYEYKFKELKEYVEITCSKICEYYKYPKKLYMKYIN